MHLVRGPARLGELADRSGVYPSVVKRQIEGLESAGLIEINVHPRDLRVRIVSLTPSGRRAVNEVRRARCEAIQDALSGWSDEDLARFAGLLQRFDDALEAWFATRNAATDGWAGETTNA